MLVEAIEKVCPCKPSPPNKSAVTAMTTYRSNDTILGSQPSQTQSQIMFYQAGSDPQYCTSLPTPPFTSDGLTSTSQSALPQLTLPAEFISASQSTHNAQRTYMNPISTTVQQASNFNLSRHQTLQETAFHRKLSDLRPTKDLSAVGRSTTTASNPDLSSLFDPQNNRTASHGQAPPFIAPPVTTQAPSDTIAKGAICDQTSADPTTSTATSSDIRQSITTSLYEACRLDHLDSDELERLIAHIIREDGFTELVSRGCHRK